MIALRHCATLEEGLSNAKAQRRRDAKRDRAMENFPPLRLRVERGKCAGERGFSRCFARTQGEENLSVFRGAETPGEAMHLGTSA